MKALAICIVISGMMASAAGFCECGYTAEIELGDWPSEEYLFTDVIESDFFHIRDVELDTDWSVQVYNVSAAAARGPYGYVPPPILASSPASSL